MRQHKFKSSKEYIQNSQYLTSLVLNPPYRIDDYTTSPRVSKILSFPFGIKISRVDFIKQFFQFIFSMSLFMLTACILIFCIYLPIEASNNSLITTAKNLTKEKYLLQGNLEESSTYNKLFTNADFLSLKDSENIIYLTTNNRIEKAGVKSFLNKYPLIQFAGF